MRVWHGDDGENLWRVGDLDPENSAEGVVGLARIVSTQSLRCASNICVMGHHPEARK